jgi:hypothetical protein
MHNYRNSYDLQADTGASFKHGESVCPPIILKPVSKLLKFFPIVKANKVLSFLVKKYLRPFCKFQCLASLNSMNPFLINSYLQ